MRRLLRGVLALLAVLALLVVGYPLAAWVGSSILSSLSFCRTPEWGQWVTRAEYEAHGPRTLRAFVL